MVAFLLFGMAAVNAEAKVVNAVSGKDDDKLNQYQDSLAIYKARLDSVQTLQKAYTAFDKYRLFTSSTFYNDVAQQKLGLNTEMKDSVSQEIDNALMNIYLKHPELIKVSEAEINEAGAVNQQITKPIENTEKLVEKTPDAAVETVIAPEPEVVVKKPNFWTFKGDYAVQFLQNYISGNWHKGGESNYSALASATMEANYNNKQKVKWDNKLEMKVGFMTSRSDSLHEFKTSEDLIRYTGRFDRQAHKQWYYSLQVLAYTQFMRGLKDNDKKTYSDFMSPFTLNVSLGMDYFVETKNKKLKGVIHLAPLAFNFKYVDRKNLAEANGIKTDHRTIEDFGTQTTIELEWKPIVDLLSWKTRFYAYTTYHKLLVEWENTISLKVNNYLSTNLFLYPRFDDSVKPIEPGHTLLQFKEYFSFGFSYSM